MAHKIKRRKSCHRNKVAVMTTTTPCNTVSANNQTTECENQELTASTDHVELVPTANNSASSNNTNTKEIKANQDKNETSKLGDISNNGRPSKSVRFASVHVYEFERCQGFGSIPGNYAPPNQTITLGMYI